MSYCHPTGAGLLHTASPAVFLNKSCIPISPTSAFVIFVLKSVSNNSSVGEFVWASGVAYGFGWMDVRRVESWPTVGGQAIIEWSEIVACFI